MLKAGYPDLDQDGYNHRAVTLDTSLYKLALTSKYMNELCSSKTQKCTYTYYYCQTVSGGYIGQEFQI